MLHRLWLVALFACNGDKKDKTDHTGTDTDDGPPSFDFVTSVRARSFEAAIDPEVVALHKASSALVSAVSVVAADPKVQDRLVTNGGGGGAFRTGSLDCWTRPQFPMFSFTLDYTDCGQYAMDGGVFVEDHPSGPLLFSFLNWQVDERTVGGTFAFNTTDAFPDPLYWRNYATDASDPSAENDVAIGITVPTDSGSQKFSIEYTGGSTVDTLLTELSLWGVLTTKRADGSDVNVILGGTRAEDVPSDDPRDADVLRTPLNWLACRCPTSGTSTYDMPLHFTEVVLDIDDLEVEPDDVDDPDLVIPVDFDLLGTGVLAHTACGEYDVTYDSDDATFVLPTDRLIGVLSFQCETLAINDPVRCQALIDAARGLEAGLEIQIPKADATATALGAVQDQFDTDYCLPY
jgi:hypothetical protein